MICKLESLLITARQNIHCDKHDSVNVVPRRVGASLAAAYLGRSSNWRR